jgi:hypothetical protein
MSKEQKHRHRSNRGQPDAKRNLSSHSLNRKARRLQSEQERQRRAQIEKRGVYVHAFHHA